jgi:hypothetical protein
MFMPLDHEPGQFHRFIHVHNQLYVHKYLQVRFDSISCAEIHGTAHQSAVIARKTAGAVTSCQYLASEMMKTPSIINALKT